MYNIAILGISAISRADHEQRTGIRPILKKVPSVCRSLGICSHLDISKGKIAAQFLPGYDTDAILILKFTPFKKGSTSRAGWRMVMRYHLLLMRLLKGLVSTMRVRILCFGKKIRLRISQSKLLLIIMTWSVAFMSHVLTPDVGSSNTKNTRWVELTGPEAL